MAGRNGGSRPSDGSLYAFDAAWLVEREGPLAGADEAGRGALAGPLVAAAAILGEEVVGEIRDSKLLSVAARERLLGEVLRCARAVSVVAFPAWWIDQNGLGLANREALRRAIYLLDAHAGCGLADGNLRLGPEIECLPRADANSATVAAASIVAKVLRDHVMGALSGEYDAYGFERNRGYGTLEHRRALAEVGPCRVHRMTYAGVGP